MDVKTSSLGALVALVLALLLVWFAWEGFQVLTWRIRYMAPAFFAGALVGGSIVAMLTSRE